MPDQEVATVVKKDFWKKFRVGFRNFGKMTVDAAVQNRSVVIEVRRSIFLINANRAWSDVSVMCSLPTWGVVCWDHS